MKIIKKILKLLLILILLIIVVSFFLPSEAHVERSVVINAPAEIIFPHLNNLKSWQKWSPWEKKDTAMTKAFEGNIEGIGAKYSWSGNSEVGTGNMAISACVLNDSIQTTMEFGGMGKSYGSYKLKKDSAGTKVTWSFDTKGEGMPWYMKVPSKYFNLLGMDKMLGKDFEEGLNNLKTIIEEEIKNIPPSVSYEIISTTTSSKLVASYRMTTSEKTISSDMAVSFGKIGKFAMKKNLKQAGAVLTIYHSYSPEKIEMECAVPIDNNAKGEGEINVFEMKGGNVVKLNYYGAYEKMAGAHDALHKYIGENNKKITGSPWEVYVTDPMAVTDTAKWLTEIYYPVE